MLARLEQVEIGGLPWPLDDARDDLQRLIGKVIRHRQKGADLVWEAYNVDIGGPEDRGCASATLMSCLASRSAS